MQLWTLHSQLLVAIQYNDVTAADELLKKGIDPDIRFRMGSHTMPALCLCAEKGHYEMAKLLIDHGCSTNQLDDCGYTPLHFASSHLFVDIVKLLLANRANINAVTHYGHTPLHLAVQQPSLEIVKLLTEAGCKLERKDHDGRTPLALACIHNQGMIAEYLVSQGADVNTIDNCGNSPLLHAINTGLSINMDIVAILLEAGANPNHTNKYGVTALITAIRRSSEHSLDGPLTIAQLIDHQCNLNEYVYEYGSPWCGENALHLAITRNQDRITEMLIRAGCDVDVINHGGLTALSRLAPDGKIDLVKLLIAVGANLRLPKEYWTNDENVLRNVHNMEIREIIMRERSCFPTLKQLSRIKIRQWLERRADSVIKQLHLPTTIRQYLLLLDL